MAAEVREKRFSGKSVFNIFTGTLTRKLGSGFGAILVILIALVVYTESKLSEVSELSERVSNLRLPTLDASKSMLSGVNRSLAGLRGYMLLGKDIFKAERQAAWEEDMLPALAFLTEISKNWTNPENVAKLEQIKTELSEFQIAQEEIENISQTLDNNLSMKILFEEAAPEAAVLSKTITEIIDEELTLEATPERKALLGMMADVRGTLGLSLANIRAYILTGDDQFQDKFNVLWTKNSRRFQNLTDNYPFLTAS
ncbi:MAG: MCP four helix bundle domain-containing protein, partial [Candidatus Marinimicrobia bacterium]|nr:MCP four helix bundle domain-containing protein [Candidatus Neomarinimicrobiota bacterium]